MDRVDLYHMEDDLIKRKRGRKMYEVIKENAEITDGGTQLAVTALYKVMTGHSQTCHAVKAKEVLGRDKALDVFLIGEDKLNEFIKKARVRCCSYLAVKDPDLAPDLLIFVPQIDGRKASRILCDMGPLIKPFFTDDKTYYLKSDENGEFERLEEIIDWDGDNDETLRYGLTGDVNTHFSDRKKREPAQIKHVRGVNYNDNAYFG